MPRSAFLAVAALAFLLPSHGQSDERPRGGDKPGLGLPPLTGDDAVGVDVHDLNVRLRNQYRELARSRGVGVSVAEAAKTLSNTLDELVTKDAALKKLGKAEIDRIIRTGADRERTAALVHAWASLSILAAETDRLAKEGLFDRADLAPLVALPGPSALASLLALAEQAAASADTDEEHKKAEKAAGGRIDLIRFRLREKFIFGVELAYDHGWRKGERPAFMKDHDRYIPSFGDLVGGSADAPEPQRDLLSLWGLVNLVADRQCQMSRGGSEEVGKRLKWLADWLASLRGHRAMKVLNAATGGKPTIERLTTPLDHIEAFLRFREAAIRPDALEGMAGVLMDFRDQARPEGEKADAARKRLLDFTREKKQPALKHLVEAAAPVGERRLHHAVAWLRYVLLLSYKGQRTVVADSKAANGMAEAWKAFGTGLELDFPVDAKPWTKQVERPAPAVRWNQQPHAGQASAVVADLTLACLGHLRFDAFVAARQKDRFSALRSTDTMKAYFDKGFDDALNGLERTDRYRLAPLFVRTKGEVVGTTFPPPGEPARLAEIELDVKGKPLPLTKDADPQGPVWRSAFAASATPDERRRLRDDLLVLAIEMQRSIQVQKAGRDAVKDGKPAAFQLLAGLGGFGLGDLGELPRKTFPQYKKDLDKAISELKEKAEAVEAGKSLVAAYDQSRRELGQAREELEAARLGRRIAEKGSELSEIFKQIAELDLQIEELGHQMAVLDGRIAEKKGHATELRLVGATRLRDLAARKVEALIAASEQAEEIAKEATREIERLGGKFKDAAREIEDREKRERAFGILKAVITVVGAALAPFTGGPASPSP